jgi:hypothetical protein
MPTKQTKMNHPQFCEKEGFKKVYSDILYPSDQLKKGTEVELVHFPSKTEQNEQKAKCLAKHNLDKQREQGAIENYYDKIKKIENVFEKKNFYT